MGVATVGPDGFEPSRLAPLDRYLLDFLRPGISGRISGGEGSLNLPGALAPSP